MDLTANVVASNPSHLPLSHHVHHFISLNRASCCCESSESLLGVDSLFDEAVILLDNVIQILHRPMAAAAPDNPRFLQFGNRRWVGSCKIGIDHPGLAVGTVAKCPAE